ncbi:hypothetical protein ACO0K9_12150 [Undibacterium sp. Ji50W]|uniref:hypothetical protein n=1 Tax=Undibacterium sp. Ji50W TaxID=3413041 RepID=UPI003BF2008B
MVIVWGKKHVFTKLGYVADFCPLCRKPRAFEIKRIGLAGHVYYITVGKGDLVGYERTCQTCKTILNADLADYACVPKKNEPMPALVKMSNPYMLDVLKDRLALEEIVRKSPETLKDEVRFSLIKSPFYILSPMVERRLAKVTLDLEFWLAVGASIVLFKTLPSLAEKYFPQYADKALLASLIFSLLLVFWQMLTSGSRYVKKQIVPVLAISLKPLRPKVSELNVIVREMKERKHKMGRKIKVADIQRYLKQN